MGFTQFQFLFSQKKLLNKKKHWKHGIVGKSPVERYLVPKSFAANPTGKKNPMEDDGRVPFDPPLFLCIWRSSFPGENVGAAQLLGKNCQVAKNWWTLEVSGFRFAKVWEWNGLESFGFQRLRFLFPVSICFKLLVWILWSRCDGFFSQWWVHPLFSPSFVHPRNLELQNKKSSFLDLLWLYCNWDAGTNCWVVGNGSIFEWQHHHLWKRLPKTTRKAKRSRSLWSQRVVCPECGLPGSGAPFSEIPYESRGRNRGLYIYVYIWI